MKTSFEAGSEEKTVKKFNIEHLTNFKSEEEIDEYAQNPMSLQGIKAHQDKPGNVTITDWVKGEKKKLHWQKSVENLP